VRRAAARRIVVDSPFTLTTAVRSDAIGLLMRVQSPNDDLRNYRTIGHVVLNASRALP